MFFDPSQRVFMNDLMSSDPTNVADAMPFQSAAVIQDPRSFMATPLSADFDFGSVPDEEKTTLWQGDLEPWMDEQFVKQVWVHFGENVEVKMIRDKFSGYVSTMLYVGFNAFH